LIDVIFFDVFFEILDKKKSNFTVGLLHIV